MEKIICSNCVMDNSDSKITFDEKGVCDWCNNVYKNTLPRWYPNEKGRKLLEPLIEKIKKQGQGKDFECIIGLSGGADSSYLLHVAVKEFGLRPLVFHVDGGWDSQISVNNIEVMVDKLKLELFTEVINWEEMKDLQLSFFKAGVSHIDVPQDHAFISTLYHFAKKYNVKYILNGGNISTECVNNPLDWLYYGSDIVQLRDIHRKFGKIPLDTYPLTNILWHKVYLRYVKGIKRIEPLNYVPYIKKEAMEFLSREYGWQPYPQKHFESRFTKFFEGYWLPVRFGYDTRRVQFSSLILTGQMTREEALKELEKPSYDKINIKHDFEYIATKLGITVDELKKYQDLPKKSYKDYKSLRFRYNIGAKVLRSLGVQKITMKR